MKIGKTIFDSVDACQTERGELAFWWLGQHSFIVKTGDVIIYLDPFLSPMEGRIIPPLLTPRDITHAHIICGTHDHADHIDRDVWPALAVASPKATFVVPDLIRSSLARDLHLDPSRLAGLDDGTSVSISGVRITGVAAAHELLDRDAATGRHPYLGYVLEANGCAIYHSGDCCVYEGLLARLRRWKIDVAFLPINGRDSKRLAVNCIGNMSCHEAADLAGALQPRLVVPAHYDMFAMNLGDVKEFAAYMRLKYPAQAVCVPGYGTCVKLGPA